ncbi:hypothetical protein HBH98_142150 [Parastagonospora nodorum]|nr:hypothetical protein HBH53_149400 [Parastagonospora nodorum]KAH4050706.1 hypothetical protein HBH49_122170 [Parastagonospora nodorum]KAH4070044.1 hypothetical protein HBH50_093320 [Parastagonospora nodorum]KAH4090609.1 hypothetical protein HBH48_097090 [Parastagonospora nodorum]KAH4162663.1 hypothetical protein HBH43_162680 [Parastagonospora nodorum]
MLRKTVGSKTQRNMSGPGLVSRSDDRLMPWPILSSTCHHPTPLHPTMSPRSPHPFHSGARVLRRRLQ